MALLLKGSPTLVNNCWTSDAVVQDILSTFMLLVSLKIVSFFGTEVKVPANEAYCKDKLLCR